MFDSKIIAVWKPVGYSTHEVARQLAEKQNTITSHTGTLDPLAEGVVIILFGDKRHKKYEYAAWPKTYEFEICFGIKTDTYDGLGLVTHIVGTDVDRNKLKKVVAGFKGNYTQPYPPYSSKKIKGKPLHWYARNEKLDEIDIPNKEGVIHSIKLVNLQQKPLSNVVASIVKAVKQTKGDLRQKEITDCWDKVVKSMPNKKVTIAKVKVKMSKGLYVRGLSQDIAEELGTIGFVSNLVRTKNGRYSKRNSKDLEKILKN